MDCRFSGGSKDFLVYRREKRVGQKVEALSDLFHRFVGIMAPIQLLVSLSYLALVRWHRSTCNLVLPKVRWRTPSLFVSDVSAMGVLHYQDILLLTRNFQNCCENNPLISTFFFFEGGCDVCEMGTYNNGFCKSCSWFVSDINAQGLDEEQTWQDRILDAEFIAVLGRRQRWSFLWVDLVIFYSLPQKMINDAI